MLGSNINFYLLQEKIAINTMNKIMTSLNVNFILKEDLSLMKYRFIFSPGLVMRSTTFPPALLMRLIHLGVFGLQFFIDPRQMQGKKQFSLAEMATGL